MVATTLADIRRYLRDQDERTRRMPTWWDEDDENSMGPLNLKGAREAFRLIGQIGVSCCAGCAAALSSPLQADQDGRLWHRICYDTLRCPTCRGPKHRSDSRDPWCGYCANTPYGRWLKMWGDIGAAVRAANWAKTTPATYVGINPLSTVDHLAKAERRRQIAQFSRWCQAWGDIGRAYLAWTRWIRGWVDIWGAIGRQYYIDCTEYRRWHRTWVSMWKRIGKEVVAAEERRVYVLLNASAAKSADPTERRFAQLELDKETTVAPVPDEEEDRADRRFRLLEIE